MRTDRTAAAPADPARLAPGGQTAQRRDAAASPGRQAPLGGQALPPTRMATEDIATVAAEAYEVVEDKEER
jgi:hypothetical protein